MQCYTELTPPTAVSHAVSFPFLSPDSKNLIVARTSLLQVFTFKTTQEELDAESGRRVSTSKAGQITDRRILENDELDSSFLGADAAVQQSERVNLTKLVLVAEYQLSGTVTSLARVKLQASKTGADALLIAFREAKLSLVDWDPERHGLCTISIHYYEREELERSPWAPEMHRCVHYLTVDPRSRCAALKFGSRNLAILPFRQAGDDLVMEDYDSDIDGEREDVTPSKPTNGDAAPDDTPYSPSFVLPLTALDPGLVHLIHLAFLFEYRGPTFGILSSSVATAASALPERRDILAYTVFTLDMEQRASTTILSVAGLPYDLHTVIPLPPPVGGALLVGINELIHVDQAGRTNAVSVNEFARECSSFSMTDQSELALKLEGCTIEQMGAANGDMLIILKTGELAILEFKLDGRTVSGLSVRKVLPENGGLLIRGSASCAALFTKGRVFVGSEDGDSVLLGWAQQSNQTSKQRRQSAAALDTATDESDEDMDDYDDDLYSGGDAVSQKPIDAGHATISSNTAKPSGEYVFRIQDSLLNIAPIHDITFGAPSGLVNQSTAEPTRLDMMLASGSGRGGSVTMISRELSPEIVNRFQSPDVQGIWSIRAKRPVPKALATQAPGMTTAQLDGDRSADTELDRFVVLTMTDDQGDERSTLHAATATGFATTEVAGTEWESEGGTVDLGVLHHGTRIIQVLKSEIRSYDGDIGLTQIFPIVEDASGAEPKVLDASFADPYLLLIRDDHSLFIIQCDENGELEEVEVPNSLTSLQWPSGCLYSDRDGAFGQASPGKGDRDVKMFLLAMDYVLHIYSLRSLNQPLCVLTMLSFLPSMLPAESAPRRPPRETSIMDFTVGDLGDNVAKKPYLILRTLDEEIFMYEPFLVGLTGNGQEQPSTLRFLRTTVHAWAGTLSGESQKGPAPPMRILSDVGGYSAVFIPGEHPGFLLRSAACLPKYVRLREKKVKWMSGFHSQDCPNGWLYVNDEGVVLTAQLQPDWRYAELGWPARKIPLGEEVQMLSYHAPMNSYALATVEKTPFELPRDDDLHRHWAQEDITFKPDIDQSSIKLLSPVNWSIIDTHALPPQQVILCLSTVHLEVSESSHERRHLIAVGTSNTHAADQASRGSIYVFDLIRVIPEPGRPETDRRLKLVAREDVKGAVTALSEVGSQGFLLVAQGQKCMVRGLKEDGTLLPVAFLDMMCHVSVARCLPGTGLCLMGDAVKGVWFVGYMEEPYKMTVFGKSTALRLEVMSAEFLPAGEQLYIVVADADCNIHVLQYDPEHPKSLSGMHLLHLRSFHTGHFPTKLLRLPSSSSSSSSPTSSSLQPTPGAITPSRTTATNGEPQNPSADHQILTTARTGVIALLSLLPETSYRRLLSIQSQLLATLEHACGLNPKSYRLGMGGLDLGGSSTGFGGGAGAGSGGFVGGGGGGGSDRAVLDGALIARLFTDVDVVRRNEILNRVGTDELELREDLRAVGAVDGASGVLGYL